MKQFRQKYLLAIMGVLLSAVAMVCFTLFVLQGLPQSSSYKFLKGWEASVKGSEFLEDQDLSVFSFVGLKKGDSVVVMNEVPEEFGNDYTMLLLTHLTAVEVYLDGKLIYDYGRDLYRRGHLLGSGYHFVRFPKFEGWAGLKIKFLAAEDNAFTNVPYPEIIKSEFVYSSFAMKHLTTVFICLFLVVLGLILTILSVVGMFFNRIFGRLLLIGNFTFLAGIWSSCNTKIWQLFGVDMSWNSMFEYLSLYLAPVPLLILIYVIRRDAARWKRRLMILMNVMAILFVVTACVLHVSGVAHFPKVLTCFHVLGVLILVFAFVSSMGKFSEMSRFDKTFFAGAFEMLFFAALDLVRYNVQKYLFPGAEWLTMSVLPLGVLIFAVILVASYLFHVMGRIVDQAKQEALAHLAYFDSLCSLNNRNCSMEDFEKLDGTDRPYSLVSMDLNCLKFVNDNLGHASGDLLLKEYANALRESFSEIGKMYRMGGDEFLVLIPAKYEAEIEGALKKLVKLEAECTERLGFVMECSYGVAHSYEYDRPTVERVLALADKRLYAMKAKSKFRRKTASDIAAGA